MDKQGKVIDDKEIQSKIDANREEIDSYLNSDLPLDLIYFNIKISSARNERLIKQLKGS